MVVDLGLEKLNDFGLTIILLMNRIQVIYFLLTSPCFHPSLMAGLW